MAKKSFSKAEISRSTRATLRRYKVDMQHVSIIASPKTINLQGALLKVDGHELSVEAIMKMYDELTQMARVQSSLLNWDLNGGVRKIDLEDE